MSFDSKKQINNQRINHYYALFIDKLIKEYKDKYGGHFVDHEGNLTVNFVGEIESINEEMIFKNVKYNKVEFSLDYLKKVVNMLTNQMIDLEIAMIEINEKNNKVIVYIENIDESKKNRVKKIIDSPAIEFKNQTLKIS
jgi:hypothetical protein